MSSSSEKKTPGALAGKSSRPCDSCIFRRAKWYCAADDAFLCQICDASVHSANLLSRRHHRLRLKVAAHKESIEPVNDVVEISPPPWNLGFRRKARTPRHTKPLKVFQNPLIVPEINSDEVFPEENEAQVLYQVPIFDPVMESKELSLFPMYQCGYANLNDSLPTELNMTEFSVNMENLLGRGLDEDSFCMSLLDHKEEDDMSCNVRVKVEQGEERQEYLHMMEKKENNASVLVHFTEEKKRILLKLDYEAVLAAWEKKDSPWMTGDRPQLDPDESWPDLMSNFSSQSQTYREMTVLGGNMTPLNGGREARVSRYREKRRTRAFAKKIRYEVRKLNAEKRPRMKGRFVKRASFVSEQKHHWINAIGA